MPRQTLILDSSQISTFLECPERWRLAYSESITSSNARDEAMTAGTLGHKLIEIYYTAMGQNKGQAEAAREALAFNPDEADSADKHQYPLSEEMQIKVRERFKDYLMCYAARDYAPITKKVQQITINELGFPIDTSVCVPLVEQGFSYELLNTNEYLFVLEGRIDFIGETNGTTVWMDHKFQFRERELYKKSIQFRNYALVTGLSLGVINYIRLHQKITEKTFIRQPISFSSLERQYWKQELIEIFKKISNVMKTGSFERNRSACSGQFGYPCSFVSICEEYNKDTACAIKERDFVKKIEWRPW